MTCAVAVMVAISTGLQIALTMCQPFHISSHLILRRPCEVGTVIPILHRKTLYTRCREIKNSSAITQQEQMYNPPSSALNQYTISPTPGMWMVTLEQLAFHEDCVCASMCVKVCVCVTLLRAMMLQFIDSLEKPCELAWAPPVCVSDRFLKITFRIKKKKKKKLIKSLLPFVLNRKNYNVLHFNPKH